MTKLPPLQVYPFPLSIAFSHTSNKRRCFFFYNNLLRARLIEASLIRKCESALEENGSLAYTRTLSSSGATALLILHCSFSCNESHVSPGLLLFVCH